MIHLEESKRTKIRGLRRHLSGQVMGQAEAISAIVPILKAGECGLSDPERPKGSFLFLGPTGVGKTELAIAFTEYLFGKGRLIRIDMSEYQHPDSINRILGPQSEVGSLESRMKSVPDGTILFDEIEKAHPPILDLLLQMLDCGTLTLASGTILELSQYYIVLTSNIASMAIASSNQSGVALKRFVRVKAEEYLRPELVGRLDEVVVFQRLLGPVIRQVQGKFARIEKARLRALGITTNLTLGNIVPTENGGARGLRRDVAKILRRRALEEILGADLETELLTGEADEA